MSNPDSQLPLVTVITATFNLLKSGREACFRQCVESVHAQTYGAIEHIVIDGASSDGTLELIAEYEAKGWLTCHSEPDSGLYDGMNKGIRAARGKYIAFLNSDDFWHDARGVAESVRCLEAAEADFSYAPCTKVSQDGSKGYVLEPRIESFFCEMPFVHQTMFCRTELLRQMGGFNQQEYRLAADYELITRIILNRGRSVRVPLNFTSFRLGGASGDNQSSDNEVSKVHQQHYAPLIGEEDARRLVSGLFPELLPATIASQLSPEILFLLGRSMRSSVHAGYCCLAPRASAHVRWKGPLGLPLLARRSVGCTTSWSLLGAIPLLVAKTQTNESFAHELRLSLLGFIPLWRRVCRFSLTTRHYLFSCIPVWTCHRK